MEDKKYFSVTNNVFTIQETDEKNVLLFYRNDGAPLANITREPMDLYQAYVAHKMFSGEITSMIMSNISYKISDDETCLMLVVDTYNNENNSTRDNNDESAQTSEEKSTKNVPNIKKQNFFKRLIEKIFK